MIPHVFSMLTTGATYIQSDDPDWLNQARGLLASRYPTKTIRDSKPKYPAKFLAGGPHLFAHALTFPDRLDEAACQALRDLGAVGAGPYAIAPAVAHPTRVAGPAQVSPDAWARNLKRWLKQQEGLVHRRLSGWRLPHAELRQLILNGFFDDAVSLLQTLYDENPDLAVEIVRYWIWLEHRRERPLEVISLYEAQSTDLVNDEVRVLVAHAYLDRPSGEHADVERAAELLEPLISTPFATKESAGAFALAARCHARLGQAEAARAALSKAWPFLEDTDRAVYQVLKDDLGDVPASGPVLVPLPVGDHWGATLNRFDDEAGASLTEAFFGLWGAAVKASPGDVPVAAWQRLAEAALSLALFDEARAALEHLWARRDTLSGAQADMMRMNLVRDADRRADYDGVLRYVEGWDSIPAVTDVLTALARAYAASGRREEAANTYRRAHALGVDSAEVLIALALDEAERYDTRHDSGHGEKAHERFMQVFSQHTSALTPALAERWMMVLYDLDRPDDAHQVLASLLGGLDVKEIAAWYGVLEWQLAFILAHPLSQEAMSRIFADHLVAAIEAGQEASVLSANLERALKRLTDLSARIDFMEDVEGAVPSPLRAALGAEATNAVLEQVHDLRGHDPALTRRLLLLVYGLEGREPYEQALEMYEEAVANAPDGLADVAEEEAPRPLLVGKRIALVGGYNPVLASARDQLTDLLGAAEVVVVPPSWEEHHDSKSIADRIRQADLVLVMWRCLKHQTTGIVNDLASRGVLKGAVRPVDGKGSSSYMRGAIAYATEHWTA